MDTKIRQRRAQVLQEMDEIQTMERGKLCQMHRGGAGSEERVYFNHQYWQSGRNHSRYVARPAPCARPLKAASVLRNWPRSSWS